MKILYTGPCRLGSLTEARRLALIELGHEVHSLDRAPYLDQGGYVHRKLQLHLHIGFGIRAYGKDLYRLALKVQPDLIYIDIGLCLSPKIVSKLKETTQNLIHYSSEYFGFNSYTYRHFFKTVDVYDAHIITNDLVVPDLEKRGAKKIFKTHFGFDPELHRPMDLTEEDRERYQSDAVFIGHWEPETEAKVAALRGAGVKVKVWGPGWKKAKSLDDRESIKPVYGEEYIKVINASKICLGFLSKWNFNTSASRTFEVPACGSFLLTEKTEEQLSYFKEDKEAVYFKDNQELIEKAQYYLKNEEARLEVKEKGHERCLNSGYTHKDGMRKILESIG